MNIIIAGAGELGRLLAAKLSNFSHDIVIIDTDAEILKHINEKLDVRVLEGSCLDISVLKNAGIEQADAFLALSGNEASNIIGCQLAAKFGVKKTVCRLNSRECFSKEDGIGPESMGIWNVVEPHEECVSKIQSVLKNRVVMEEIRFSHPDAVIAVLQIRRSCFLAGTRIKDVQAEKGLLESIRFAALVRDRDLLVPHGDTILVPGDKVYIAGHEKNVKEFISWVAPEEEIPESARILVTGATPAARRITSLLTEKGYDVRFILKDRREEEKLLEQIPSGLLAINGDPTDEEVLEEAGVSGCCALICADADDEKNILGCLIGKRMGAEKTIAVTFKPEYIRIVPTMAEIDCGFSSTLAAVNAVLRMLETRTILVDAFLQIFNADLTEFKVSRKSPLCGKKIMESGLPASILLALVFRKNRILTPKGDTVLKPDDVIVAIMTSDSEREFEKYFPRD